MAGNPPVFIGSVAVDAGAATATPTITTTAPVAAGDAILTHLHVLSGGPTFTSVTNGGDTFASVGTAVNNFLTRLAYCLSSAGLASGSSIVVNLSGVPGLGYYAVSAFKVAGGLAGLDVSATNSVTTAGTALAAGTTAATAQNVELAVAMFGAYVGGALPTFTAGGSNTALTVASATNGDSTVVWSEYLVTSATGAQAPTGSLNTNVAYYAGVTAVFTYPSTDPFPVASQQEFPNSRAGRSPLLRMHHREPRDRSLPHPRHRNASGLYLLAKPADYLPGKSGLFRAA